MKKIILSMASVLVLVGLVAGVTGAYFTDQVVNTENTFSTGILDITGSGSAYSPIELAGNLKPGDTISKVFTVRNNNQANFGGNSTLPGKLSLLTVKTAGDDLLYDVIQAKVTRLQWGQVVVFNGLLKDLTNVDGQAILQPGITQEYKLELTLPASADNTLQGKTANFNFVVNATTEGV